MGIEDTGVVDSMARLDDGRVILPVFDDYYWGPFAPDGQACDLSWHGPAAQTKVNGYVDIILSGQLAERVPEFAPESGWVIEYLAYGPLPVRALQFFWDMRSRIIDLGGDLWVSVTDGETQRPERVIPAGEETNAW